jgi:hypothetical protein
MQIGECKLLPLMPFYGLTDGRTIPLGLVELPVTFGEPDNFHTENIFFNVAHFDLPTTPSLDALHSPSLSQLCTMHTTP